MTNLNKWLLDAAKALYTSCKLTASNTSLSASKNSCGMASAMFFGPLTKFFCRETTFLISSSAVAEVRNSSTDSLMR